MAGRCDFTTTLSVTRHPLIGSRHISSITPEIGWMINLMGNDFWRVPLQDRPAPHLWARESAWKALRGRGTSFAIALCCPAPFWGTQDSRAEGDRKRRDTSRLSANETPCKASGMTRCVDGDAVRIKPCLLATPPHRQSPNPRVRWSSSCAGGDRRLQR